MAVTDRWLPTSAQPLNGNFQHFHDIQRLRRMPDWVGSRLLANSYLEQVSWYVVGPISEEQQNQKRRPEAHQINDGHAAIMGDIADR
jgi:hypothetical protein